MSSLKYVKTSTELFSDAFVWSLSPEHKLLWCYISHPPQAELHGIWRYDVDQIAHTLKISPESVRQGLEIFETEGRIVTTLTHIWVKRFFKHQLLAFQTGKRVIGQVYNLQLELPDIVEAWFKFYKIHPRQQQEAAALYSKDDEWQAEDPPPKVPAKPPPLDEASGLVLSPEEKDAIAIERARILGNKESA